MEAVVRRFVPELTSHSKGQGPFELELAHRIHNSVLPDIRKLERTNYDFSKVRKGPNFLEALDLFGSSEMVAFAHGVEELLDESIGFLRFEGPARFNGKQYRSVRTLIAERHRVSGLDELPDYPSKIISFLFLRQLSFQIPQGERSLGEKLEKLADKSVAGRKVIDYGEDFGLESDKFDSMIFGTWANPTALDNGQVIYQDANLMVLHPDYASSRRAMDYDLSINLGGNYSMITIEPLRTDKNRSEIDSELNRRLERQESDEKKEPQRKVIKRIPSRTAIFDMTTGKNITETLQAEYGQQH